jgi:hypothetical protein
MHVDLSRAEIEAAIMTIDLAITRMAADLRSRPANGSSAVDRAALLALKQKLDEIRAFADARAESPDDLDLDYVLEPADA